MFLFYHMYIHYDQVITILAKVYPENIGCGAKMGNNKNIRLLDFPISVASCF